MNDFKRRLGVLVEQYRLMWVSHANRSELFHPEWGRCELDLADDRANYERVMAWIQNNCRALVNMRD